MPHAPCPWHAYAESRAGSKRRQTCDETLTDWQPWRVKATRDAARGAQLEYRCPLPLALPVAVRLEVAWLGAVLLPMLVAEAPREWRRSSLTGQSYAAAVPGIARLLSRSGLRVRSDGVDATRGTVGASGNSPRAARGGLGGVVIIRQCGFSTGPTGRESGRAGLGAS